MKIEIIRTVIFSAIYNESENIDGLIINKVKFFSNSDKLVFDDNSLDRTSMILVKSAKSQKSLNVLHRDRKLGVGATHQHAMRLTINI
ncbi:MAG: hypothetical protein MH321_13700 [Leptospiraceae bacterium]|nr:hypothetical protein [Leptospiraceae bacterium]